MKTITKIIFNVYSNKNPKRYQHTIYAEGTLNYKEIGQRQYEYVNSKGSMSALKFEDTKIEFYQQTTSVNDEESEANAAFICKAVNSYDKLIEQNNSLLEALKRLVAYSKISELDAVEDYSLITSILTAKEAIKKVEQT